MRQFFNYNFITTREAEETKIKLVYDAYSLEGVHI